jgi:hypothetical protein
MAAVALAACIGHGYWMKHRVADIGAQTVSAQGPRQEMTRLNGQISALEVELKQLDKKRPAPVGSDSAEGLIRQKKRICALLEAMGHLVCQERVVTRVRAEDQGSVTIEGLCLMPDCADSLAVGLARELGKSGWEVRGAQKSARLTSPDGGPWEFKVMLLPSGTLPKPSPAVPVAGAPAKVSIPAGGPQ